MTSTSKIDEARQKLSEKLKVLEKQKGELEQENEEYVGTINELRHRVETMKSQEESPQNFQLEKTKGTFSDRDQSHDKSMFL